MSFAYVQKATKPAMSGSRINNQVACGGEENNHATTVAAETVATAAKVQQALLCGVMTI